MIPTDTGTVNLPQTIHFTDKAITCSKNMVRSTTVPLGRERARSQNAEKRGLA